MRLSRCAQIAATLVACGLFVPLAGAGAFKAPKLDGHVVDLSGKLTRDEILDLDARFDGDRKALDCAIVALVVTSLDGEPIEDVAYTAFNTWSIGDKGKDNGVLIVIALTERSVRIETGKGVGGVITDLQANDIIRDKMAPQLAAGRLRDAIDAGATAIEAAFRQQAPTATSTRKPAPAEASTFTTVVIFVSVGLGIAIIVLLIISPRFRSRFGIVLEVLNVILQILSAFGGRGGGGSSGGGSTRRGSGYKGGGGKSGGGGSSDSF